MGPRSNFCHFKQKSVKTKGRGRPPLARLGAKDTVGGKPPCKVVPKKAHPSGAKETEGEENKGHKRHSENLEHGTPQKTQ